MTRNRTDRLFEIGREAGEKYDYFMTGLAATLTAYLGQDFTPSWSTRITSDTLEAGAILVLICATVAGIKRISLANQALRVDFAKKQCTQNIEAIQQAFEHPQRVVRIPGVGHLGPDQMAEFLPRLQEERTESQGLQLKLMKRAAFAGSLRDLLLVAGFFVLLLSKILRALV